MKNEKLSCNSVGPAVERRFYRICDAATDTENLTQENNRDSRRHRRVMASSRFNDRFQKRPIMRSATRTHAQSIKMPEIRLADSARSPRRRIFAIVSRPMAAGAEDKRSRRILIFDNHRDSLRLVFESGADLGTDDDAASRREKRKSIICGLILIAMIISAMLWPLF
jgi:hypothetical protein